MRVLSLGPLPSTLEALEWWWTFFALHLYILLCGPLRYKADHALLVKRPGLAPPQFFTAEMNVVNLFQEKG